MNLKFIQDILETFTEMKSSLDILAWITGIQTLTFSCYILYTYYTNHDEKLNEEREEQELNKERNEEQEQNEIQMCEIKEVLENKKKNELYKQLLNKNNELDELIKHLNYIQNNIIIIREKLEELNNNKPIT